MSSNDFGGKACERTQRHFDAGLDRELAGDAGLEMTAHLRDCPDCRRVLEEQARVKAALKRAVSGLEVPGELQNLIKGKLRARDRRGILGMDFRHWVLAAAAVLVFTVGGVTLMRNDALLHELMEIGLIDHVHCTLELERWKKPVSFEQMQQASGRSALGEEFIDLIPVVRDELGPDFNIIQGHRCRAGERQYVHVIVTGNDGAILSLVISEKSGESLAASGIAPVNRQDLAALYRGGRDGLEVAAFETERFLAYVISNLDAEANTQIAAGLAPAVTSFLRRQG